MRFVDFIERKKQGGSHNRGDLEGFIATYTTGELPDEVAHTTRMRSTPMPPFVAPAN